MGNASNFGKSREVSPDDLSKSSYILNNEGSPKKVFMNPRDFVKNKMTRQVKITLSQESKSDLHMGDLSHKNRH